MREPRHDVPKCPDCAWAMPMPSQSDENVDTACALLEQHLVSAHHLAAEEAKVRVARWAAFAFEETTQVE